jgi:hypothetical protein
MISPFGERATEDAVNTGKAILKFISPNDVGLTGGHQCGYYLPKKVWQIFSPHPWAQYSFLTLFSHVEATYPESIPWQYLNRFL